MHSLLRLRRRRLQIHRHSNLIDTHLLNPISTRRKNEEEENTTRNIYWYKTPMSIIIWPGTLKWLSTEMKHLFGTFRARDFRVRINLCIIHLLSSSVFNFSVFTRSPKNCFCAVTLRCYAASEIYHRRRNFAFRIIVFRSYVWCTHCMHTQKKNRIIARQPKKCTATPSH